MRGKNTLRGGCGASGRDRVERGESYDPDACTPWGANSSACDPIASHPQGIGMDGPAIGGPVHVPRPPAALGGERQEERCPA